MCLASPSCKGGGQAVDGAGERAVTVVQADTAIEEPESSPLTLVLDPDDEAFEETHLGWSKASKKMSLDELPSGIPIYVTYTVDFEGKGRRNRALKVIIPGGMEDVAKMILAEPELDPAPKK